MLAIGRSHMPKAKPVSPHPLTFDEAIKSIIGVDLQRVEPGAKRFNHESQ